MVIEPVLKVGLAGVGSVSRTILHNIQKIPGAKLTAVARQGGEGAEVVATTGAGPFQWKEAVR